jgi:TonB-dependent receptor
MKRILIIGGLCLAMVPRLGAQKTGSVKGTVIDSATTVIGATIYLENDKGKGTVTDLNGNFVLKGVPVGEINLIIASMGYSPAKIKVNILENDTMNIGEIKLVQGTELKEYVLKDAARQNEIKAIELTKMSTTIVNILSAEGMAKLPDRNAAEVLQRLPGIVIEKDQGEGRYVSFRGTPTDWSSAVVNGDRLPAADEDSKTRALNFDILPSSLIEFTIVSKSFSPDMEGDAIGGTANFLTRKAPGSRILQTSLGGGANFQSMGPIVNGMFLYGDRTKNDQFGWLVGASCYSRSWGTDNYQVFYGGNFDQSIGRYELRDYNGHRTTIGANAALQFKPNKNNILDCRFVYGQMIDDEYNRKTMYVYNAGLGQSIKLQNIHNIMSFQFFGVVLNGEHTIGAMNQWKIEWQLANYNNTFQYGNVPFSSNNPANGYFVTEFEKAVQFTDYLYLDANGNQTDEFNAVERYKFLNIDSPIDGYGDPYNNIQPTWKNLPAFNTQDTLFLFQRAYTETNTTYERDPIVAKIDVIKQVNKKLKIKFGAKYRWKMGERKVALNIWGRNSTAISYIPYEAVNPVAVNTFGGFLAEIGSPYENKLFPFMSNDWINHFIARADTALVYEPFAKTTPYYDQFIGSSYTYYEHVISGYVMGDYRPVDKLLISAGVRVEYTMPSVSADTVIAGATAGERVLEQRTAGQNYISILPSINIKWDFTKRSIFKLAAFRSFRRPNFNEIKPAQAQIDYTNFDVTYGNPGLKPSFSWNADIVYEYYIGRTGLITVGGFAKYVSDHIYTAFESAGLDATGVSNQFQIPGGVISKKYQNAPDAYIFGGECSIYTKFGFLPKFLKNFGINATYTYSYSRMSIDSRNELQKLPRQSDHVANVALFYEDNKLNARIALNYKSPYLMELNLFAVKDPVTQELNVVHQNNDFDIFMYQSLTLDLSASYKFKKNWSIFVELNNLTNAPYIIYRGQRERPVKTEYYSIRGIIGLKFEL